MTPFALQHPYLTFFIVIATLATIESLVFKIINRFFRCINIVKRGWPTSPGMDADGDIVNPAAEKETK